MVILMQNSDIMQTHLFNSGHVNNPPNLLPKNGCINYHPELIEPIYCSQLFDQLKQNIAWQFDEIQMFGKKIVTQRKVAWIADSNCSYTYSGVKKYPDHWTQDLLDIKLKVEKVAGFKFNACLLNFYHNGSEGMGWHSDDEKELDPTAPIASVSLGATRKFAFKHKIDKTVCSFFLESGSALIMYAPTQRFWNHSLLKTKRPVMPRINLTFRVMHTK